jgi:hypothetical protein
MTFIQYRRNVTWDVTLELIGYGENGLVVDAVKKTTGAPNTNAGKFIPGAQITNKIDATVYLNTGSTASPVWTLWSPGVTGSTRQVVAKTNGTTPVNVFANPSGVAGTILSVSVTALDATAGNIVVKDTAGTVATVAKGTTVGVTTGATTIANPGFTAAGILTVESSSAGNAVVTITYTQA